MTNDSYDFCSGGFARDSLSGDRSSLEPELLRIWNEPALSQKWDREQIVQVLKRNARPGWKGKSRRSSPRPQRDTSVTNKKLGASAKRVSERDGGASDASDTSDAPPTQASARESNSSE